MSSSPRSALPIRNSKRLTPPATGWKCPECGQKALVRVNKPCQLEDGIVMPKLDRLHCRSCKEDFFDLYAMDQIAEFRKLYPYKKPMVKRHNVGKQAVAK